MNGGMSITGRAKEIIDAHAAAIIKTVMADRKMGRVDFQEGRTPRFVRARRFAIRLLRAEGLSMGHIAEVMRVDKKTVEYNLSARVRAHRTAQRTRRYAAVVQAARNTAEMAI